MTRNLLYLFIICISLAACTDRKANNDAGNGADAEGKPTVSVTIEPFHYFVDQIARGKVNVNVMVPAGSNPETYEPTPRQMVSLAQSDLYLKVGHIGFETTWMKKLCDNAPQMKVTDTSRGIVPAKTASGIADPHTWMSCTSARVIARNICKALCTAYPQHAGEFRRNLNIFCTQLSREDAKLRKMVDKAKNRNFVIYHPALTYFARDYVLHQWPIEEEGREPSIQQIQSLIARAKREHITKVFIQREFANRNTQTFIDATGTTPIEINPLAYEWEQQIEHVAKSIAE